MKIENARKAKDHQSMAHVKVVHLGKSLFSERKSN